ncbi:iron complex outermembrane receptor protein [Litorivivens lipolytica]|uniref:Iron complex outermembrane receptor protein n=1 Tax=Litorivivens lipolytica TaxID=1524264 RepID=A0A7W4W298_9GAMM|nr:TonB-dependent receptor [Litorivivens lipolytica]MBB3045823.1 iron complex outermembrane receptor protein [Litorivivens lipolytica]
MSMLFSTVMQFACFTANAQEAPVEKEASSENGGLPETTKSGLVIEEVYVTVSKRSESLQKVLGSVSALSGETLQDNNVQDFNSLVELIPGVVAQDEQKIAIRGISRTRNGPSPVSFHVNDVFIGSQGADIRGEPFYDLGAIEVVRGPSGTLFGRNSTAGAINAKWRAPELEWAIGGDIRYSSLTESHARAYINIPLLGEDNPLLLGRIAMIKRESEGTLDNLLTLDSDDPGNIRDEFVRLYLTSEPTDNVQIGLRAIRYESTPREIPFVGSPSLATRRSGVLEELGAQSLPEDLTKVRSRVSDNFGLSSSEFTRIDGDISWLLESLPVLGDVEMVLVGGEMRRKQAETYDVDGTEEPILEGVSLRPNDVRRTAELRFASQNDSGFDWLFGLFWFEQIVDRDNFVLARAFVKPSDLGAPALPGETSIIVDVEVNTPGEELEDKSSAVFLNLDMDLAELFNGPPVELTVGLRRNSDEFTLRTPQNDIIAKTPLGAVFPVTEQRDGLQFAEFDETTGELGARWFYSEAGMAYLKYARGYKPGLAQTIEKLDGSIIQNPVDPEFIDAWEAGLKTSFFDRTLQFNAAAFYYDYQDLQVSQITPGGIITENAASATIQGFEIETQWTPTASLFIQASAAWTDATYNDYCGTDEGRLAPDSPEPGCTDKAPLDFSGERLTAAPEFSAVLLANYLIYLGDWGTLTPSLKISWSDDLDRRGVGNPNDHVVAHSTSDFRLTWESPSQHWKVQGFVENLEGSANDDIFFSAFTPVAIGAEQPTFSLFNNIPPRLVGLSVEARF